MSLSSDLKLISDMALSLSFSASRLPVRGDTAVDMLITLSSLVKKVSEVERHPEFPVETVEMDGLEIIDVDGLPASIHWELLPYSFHVTLPSRSSDER
jgi:hypothetical protein